MVLTRLRRKRARSEAVETEQTDDGRGQLSIPETPLSQRRRLSSRGDMPSSSGASAGMIEAATGAAVPSRSTSGPSAMALQLSGTATVLPDAPGLKVSKVDKKRLHTLYANTYKKIGGELLDEEEFMDKLGSYYDKVIVTKNQNNEITNAVACWENGNPNGSKICLIFGDGGKEAAQERLSLLKKLLRDSKNNYYTEANGAVAGALLKDADIPVSMSLNENTTSHYFAIHNSHGKKIVFGNCKGAIPVSQDMRDFYSYLFEFKKTKIAAQKERPNEQGIGHFSNLMKTFGDVDSTEIPPVYKKILLSKVLKQATLMTSDAKHVDEILLKQNKLFDALTDVHPGDVASMFTRPVSRHEQNLLEDLLEEKIKKTIAARQSESKFSGDQDNGLAVQGASSLVRERHRAIADGFRSGIEHALETPSLSEETYQVGMDDTQLPRSVNRETTNQTTHDSDRQNRPEDRSRTVERSRARSEGR